MARISLTGVSVSYRMPESGDRTLKATLLKLPIGGVMERRGDAVVVNALDNVTFELNRGDRLGIMGRNGAGKTSLLKVISGIMPPTGGKVRVEGRVASLISMTLGMDADATGWFNIMHQGRHMGLSDAEIADRRNEIVEFSELADYIHVPMKAYSSGMQLRLAFSIATAFAPEVLVMDEWMSAGDAQFQTKAGERLRGLIGRSGVFVFASHSQQLLEENCNLGLVLDHGVVKFFGPMSEAIKLQQQA